MGPRSFRHREIERPLHGLKSFGVGYSLFDFINLLDPLEENKNQVSIFLQLSIDANCVAAPRKIGVVYSSLSLGFRSRFTYQGGIHTRTG